MLPKCYVINTEVRGCYVIDMKTGLWYKASKLSISTARLLILGGIYAGVHAHAHTHTHITQTHTCD